MVGVRIDNVTADDVLKFIGERVRSGRPAQIVTVNAEYVVRAHSDPEFASALRQADLATPDGAGILWAVRRQGLKTGKRVGGADLIWLICDQAAREGHRVFFLGAVEGVAAAAAHQLQAHYPGLVVAGIHSGTPARSEERSIVDLVRRSRVDVLMVAYGAPLQDLWIARNLHQTGAAISIGVGGSFDYVAGTARRAPVWMRERGLEWLWRLLRQPRRWRRMLALPRFVWLVITKG